METIGSAWMQPLCKAQADRPWTHPVQCTSLYLFILCTIIDVIYFQSARECNLLCGNWDRYSRRRESVLLRSIHKHTVFCGSWFSRIVQYSCVYYSYVTCVDFMGWICVGVLAARGRHMRHLGRARW